MLLINPVFPNRGFLPPAGLAYIAAALGKIGGKPKIIDCVVTGNYKDKIIKTLKDYSVVGITTTVGNILSALEIATLIREKYPKTRIIFGGPHATVIYDKLIPKYADIVVLGEGEDTIVELMQKEDLSSIKGIAYWQDGSVKANPGRPLIEDLDRLSFPAWHLYDLKRYQFGGACIPFASIFTSRGCPYKCIYCSKLVHGYGIRSRSLENVLAEIDFGVENLGINEFYIGDDNFTFYPNRAKQICKMIIDRKYKDLRFSLGNGIRADIGDPEMFELLKHAGVYTVAFGVESGSQEISDKLKRGLELDKVKARVDMAKKVGMKVILNILIGSPFDNMETVYRAVDFSKSLGADNVSFNMVVPLPGTELYEMISRNGRFLYDLNMGGADLFGKATYEIGSFKAKDFERMFRKAHQRYYLRLDFHQILLILNFKIYSLRTFLALLRYAWGILGATFFPQGRIKKQKIRKST